MDPRSAICVGTMHWTPRRDLAAGHEAPPAILFGPTMLCPEQALVLSAGRRASGFGGGKTTASPRRAGSSPTQPLAAVERDLHGSGKRPSWVPFESGRLGLRNRNGLDAVWGRSKSGVGSGSASSAFFLRAKSWGERQRTECSS